MNKMKINSERRMPGKYWLSYNCVFSACLSENYHLNWSHLNSVSAINFQALYFESVAIIVTKKPPLKV